MEQPISKNNKSVDIVRDVVVLNGNTSSDSIVINDDVVLNKEDIIGDQIINVNEIKEINEIKKVKTHQPLILPQPTIQNKIIPVTKSVNFLQLPTISRKKNFMFL